MSNEQVNQVQIIDITKIKNSQFYSTKLNLTDNISINDFPKSEKKILSANSFSKKSVYDLSSCKHLIYWKKNLLLVLNKHEPEIDTIIKTKSANFKSSNNLFNTVQFTIDRTETTLWVTITVSYDKDLAKKIELKKEGNESETE